MAYNHLTNAEIVTASITITMTILLSRSRESGAQESFWWRETNLLLISWAPVRRLRNRFYDNTSDAEISFVRGVDNRVTGVELRAGGSRRTGSLSRTFLPRGSGGARRLLDRSSHRHLSGGLSAAML